MEHVLTLVAAGGLGRETVRRAVRELERVVPRVAEPRWLAAGTACDLTFDEADPRDAEARVRAALAGAAVDLAAQRLAGRRKRLLVADMESTVIANEMLDELGDFAGVRAQIEGVTARAMRGELDFAGAVRERVKLLAGLGTGVLEEALERVEIDPGAAALAATMPAIRLVSGDTGLGVGWDGGERPLDRVLGPVLYSAIAFLSSLEGRPHVRRCAGPDCELFFVDRSPSGRRVWCQMKTCGHRVKSLRHYHRLGKTRPRMTWPYG